MMEVLVELVDKEHIKGPREEALDPEDHQETETVKNLNLARQDIQVLLQLSTMTILQLLDSVLMLDMVLKVVLETVMELPVVQGTLVLGKLMPGFNHREVAQERGQEKDLGSRDFIAKNTIGVHF